MPNSNFPTTALESSTGRKEYKNLIIGVLAVALIGLGTYTIIDKSKTSEVIEQQKTTLTKVSADKSDIQKSFDGSLARLDSMGTINTNLEGLLKDKNSEIAKTKQEIRGILNKRNVSAAELSKAKGLIVSLNGKITNLEENVARLTQENQGLNQDKITLTQDKEKLTTDLNANNIIRQDLEKKVDVASTLNASNITITPVDVKNNGKEKITSTAKKVNKLVISFDVINRIAASGTTDLYVCIIGPDGKPITIEKLGSGTFTSKEDGEKIFTAKVPVDLETAKNKTVAFAFEPGQNFQQGDYTIEIYQNGFKIGEGKRALKKGGLFG